MQRPAPSARAYILCIDWEVKKQKWNEMREGVVIDGPLMEGGKTSHFFVC